MADQKISQLSDGGASQATDEYVIARSGSNFRIDGASIAAAATSIGTLASLTVTGTATVGTVAGTTITEGGSAIVRQTDIGSAPNEVPLNQYLGTMAYQDAAAVLADTLTVSGNVGIGATPSAWTSAFGPIVQVRTGSAYGALTGSSTDNFRMFANTLYDGAYKRIAAGFATQYEQASGSHVWYTAGTSTANSTITFTQAMTLDASGNLGVGTATFGTSAAKVLGLANATEPSTAVADTIQFYSVDRSAGNTIPALRCEGTGVTDAGITNTTVTNKIAIKVNGTVYYLLATTNAT